MRADTRYLLRENFRPALLRRVMRERRLDPIQLSVSAHVAIQELASWYLGWRHPQPQTFKRVADQLCMRNEDFYPEDEP